jgi:acyl-CoA thioesterase FadM
VGVSSSTHAQLVEDGYRFVVPVPITATDFDRQGHLNNAAVVRMFNDIRVAYVEGGPGQAWYDEIARNRYVVAAREIHVLYESEGQPGEAFMGAMRYTRRMGKAAIVEQRIVEAETGRPLARAWLVQLLVQDGRVVEWPAMYFDLVARVEGRPIPLGPRRTDQAFGPPE